jgi:hypothetical protein
VSVQPGRLIARDAAVSPWTNEYEEKPDRLRVVTDRHLIALASVSWWLLKGTDFVHSRPRLLIRAASAYLCLRDPDTWSCIRKRDSLPPESLKVLSWRENSPPDARGIASLSRKLRETRPEDG